MNETTIPNSSNFIRSKYNFLLNLKEKLTLMANQALVDQLETFFEETIQKMDRQFTSHEFFLKLLHAHQNDYVVALAAYTDKGAPFKALHWELFKRLQKLEGKLIMKQQEDYPSRDIFGIASTTTLWRKK